MDLKHIKNGLALFNAGNRLPTISAVAVVLLLLIVLFGSPTGKSGADQPQTTTGTGVGQLTLAASEAVYACPMNCVAPMQKPGRCPVCGMELVAAFDRGNPAGPSPAQLTLTPADVHNAGIRVMPAQRQPITASIRLFGKIEYDPVEQYRVTAFAPGIIDRIYVKRAGQSVRRGDPLFDLHSSELFFLEQDLFEALKAFPDVVDYRPARGQSYKRLMRPARRTFNIKNEDGSVDENKKRALDAIDQLRRKMRLLGLSDTDVDEVIARGRPTGISTVTTPTTGIVLEHEAYKGAYVNTGETIFTVANPSYLWARLDAYESDFAWLRIGQPAEFTSDAFPGETFSGKVLYLDPFFDPLNRTFKVGVLYQDPQSRLKPNMLVRGVIQARMTETGVGAPIKNAGDKDPLVIPESAPLITGIRAIVYVQDPHDDGTYGARSVVLGPRAQGFYVVRGGLQEGERVVVNGNFKIDSAVQIQAKPSMMDHRDYAAPMTGQHHPPPARSMRDNAAQAHSAPENGMGHGMHEHTRAMESEHQ